MVLYCEICGRPIERGYLIRIEGATLVACDSCAERGEIVAEVKDRESKKFVREMTGDIVDDFAERIRASRKKKRMDLKELSKLTGISVKALKLMEEKRLVPTLEQAKKLEAVLDIELVEKYEAPEKREDDFTLTLGDVVRIR